jgi:hypothetical protein
MKNLLRKLVLTKNGVLSYGISSTLGHWEGKLQANRYTVTNNISGILGNQVIDSVKKFRWTDTKIIAMKQLKLSQNKHECPY